MAGDEYDPGVAGDALRVFYAGAEQCSFRTFGTIPGVIVRAAAGKNGPGRGFLASVGDGESLRWTAPGSSTPGPAVAVPAQGVYLLEDGEDATKWLRVYVYPEHLNPTPIGTAVHLVDAYNANLIGRDITAEEADAGVELVLCLALFSATGSDLTGAKAWLDATASGYAFLSLAAAQAGPYVSPDSESHPDAIELGVIPGDGLNSRELYVKQTIPAHTAFDPAVLGVLRFGWNTP